MHLDVPSKLDRSRPHIEELMEHGAQQANDFLQVISSRIAFETTWNNTLRDKEEKGAENVDAIDELLRRRARH
jgi:hypothetical protein